MKVLIVKRDKLGDLLLTTPMLAHLKGSRPDAEVHLLANDYNAWVVEGNRHIDRLWVYSRVRHGGKLRLAAAFQNLALHWKLRRERFDWMRCPSPPACTRWIACSRCWARSASRRR